MKRGPGAATRYIIARRHIAERRHAPAHTVFNALPVDAPDRNQGYKGVWLSDTFMVQSRVTGWETQVVTLERLGKKLCWANSPWKGNPPLTAKSLSATTVYHGWNPDLSAGVA